MPLRLIIVYALTALIMAAFVAGYFCLTRERRAFQRYERAYRQAQRVRKKSSTASRG